MKKIEALIRTSKFEEIHKCLSTLGVKFLTFYEVKGMGLQHAKMQHYRGVAYEPTFIPRTKLEIVVQNDLEDKVTACILSEAKTGKVGDGKIFVYDVEKAFRIRNDETGENAL